MSALLDTHAAIWYFDRSKELSRVALQSIRRSLDTGRPIYISAISLIETIYLVERGRLPMEALRRLEVGARDAATGFIVQPVDEDVAEAVHQIPWSVVPDMPDRIITATALHLDVPLITRDLRIQASGIHTIW
jgi:PIN domain nuclease of toxin-antitoxin system